jgi:hypothetical protein
LEYIVDGTTCVLSTVVTRTGYDPTGASAGTINDSVTELKNVTGKFV